MRDEVINHAQVGPPASSVLPLLYPLLGHHSVTGAVSNHCLLACLLPVVQEARNMYAYREELCERYRKIK